MRAVDCGSHPSQHSALGVPARCGSRLAAGRCQGFFAGTQHTQAVGSVWSRGRCSRPGGRRRPSARRRRLCLRRRGDRRKSWGRRWGRRKPRRRRSPVCGCRPGQAGTSQVTVSLWAVGGGSALAVGSAQAMWSDQATRSAQDTVSVRAGVGHGVLAGHVVGSVVGASQGCPYRGQHMPPGRRKSGASRFGRGSKSELRHSGTRIRSTKRRQHVRPGGRDLQQFAKLRRAWIFRSEGLAHMQRFRILWGRGGPGAMFPGRTHPTCGSASVERSASAVQIVPNPPQFGRSDPNSGRRRQTMAVGVRRPATFDDRRLTTD